VLEVVRSFTTYQESSGSTSAIWLCVVRRALLNLQATYLCTHTKHNLESKKGLYMGNLNLSAEGVKTQNISSTMIRLTDRTVIIRNKFHIPAYLLQQILPSDRHSSSYFISGHICKYDTCENLFAWKK
jgi:hypothetical protein